MGIISDAIKKRLTPETPDFSQYRQKVNPTPMLGEVKNAGLPKAPDFMNLKESAIPVPPTHKTVPFSDMADKSGLSKLPANPLAVRSDDVYTKVKDEHVDPYTALLDSAYQKSERDLKLQKKAAQLGDIAQLFGQAVNLGIGARQFNPIKSDAARYDDAIMRLRNGYNSAVLNSKLADIKSERNAKNREREIKLQYAKEDAILRLRALLKSGQIDQETAAKIQVNIEQAKDDKELAHVNGHYKLAAAKINQEGANTRNENTNATKVTTTGMNVEGRQGVADTNAQSREKVAGINAESRENVARINAGSREKVAQMRAKAARESRQNSDGSTSIAIMNPDSSGYEVVNVPKSKKDAVLALLPEMEKLNEAGETPRVGTFRELKLRFDSGEASAQDWNTLVQTFQYFPEFNETLKKMVGKTDSETPTEGLGWGNNGKSKNDNETDW